MQEELDAYDRINRETEIFIENKNFRIEQLEQFIRTECKSEVPSPLTGDDIDELQMRQLSSNNQERKYPPHQEWEA